MKLRWVSLIAMLSFILGGCGATYFWQNFYADFNTTNLLLQTQAGIITKVKILENIRSGHTLAATNLLEAHLDKDLLTAAALTRDGAKFNRNTSNAIELEFRARAASGYRPADDDMQREILEAFRLIPMSQDNPGKK